MALFQRVLRAMPIAVSRMKKRFDRHVASRSLPEKITMRFLRSYP
jgi:hypothetical protein